MKLRLVLFSSCTLLFSSLSLNAQQEREARLRVTTALPALAASFPAVVAAVFGTLKDLTGVDVRAIVAPRGAGDVR